MRWPWLVVLCGAWWGCQQTTLAVPPQSSPPEMTEGTAPTGETPPPAEQTPPAGKEDPPPTGETPPPVSSGPACHKTCEQLGYTCGVANDGCGNPLNCGGCPKEQPCGGGGTPNQCGAPPLVPPVNCVALETNDALEPVSGGVRGVRRCSASGWCSSNSHMGTSIQLLWGSSPEDVWAVTSEPGLVLHREGTQWSEVELPVSANPKALWGTSSHDVWAVGDQGLVLRWDGTAWRRVSVPTQEDLTGVSGTSADDVWLVGNRVALHWNGRSFRDSLGWTHAAPDPTEPGGESWTAHVWALGPQDVMTVSGHLCQRWDGQTWTSMDCGVHGAAAIWASGPEDVWVVGSYYPGYSTSIRSHWDGHAWSTEILRFDQRTQFEPYVSLWGSGPKDVWINGTLHFDGRQWTRVCSSGMSQQTLWGDLSTLLGASTQGLSHFEAGQWRQTASLRRPDVTFVRQPGGGALAMLPGGGPLTFDGAGWSGLPEAPVSAAHTYPFGTSSDDVWGGGTGLSHWNGRGWIDFMQASSFSVQAGWASSSTEALVMGLQLDSSRMEQWLWRWDGNTWTRLYLVRPQEQVADLWGSSPQDVWAVGGICQSENASPASLGVVWHWDGRTWTRVYEQSGHCLTGIFGTSDSEVWVLDSSGVGHITNWVMRWDGSTFQRLPGDFTATWSLHLAGTGPDDLWLFDSQRASPGQTRTYHFDGTGWSERERLSGFVSSTSALAGQATFAVTKEGIFYERHR